MNVRSYWFIRKQESKHVHITKVRFRVRTAQFIVTGNHTKKKFERLWDFRDLEWSSTIPFLPYIIYYRYSRKINCRSVEENKLKLAYRISFFFKEHIVPLIFFYIQLSLSLFPLYLSNISAFSELSL